MRFLKLLVIIFIGILFGLNKSNAYSISKERTFFAEEKIQLKNLSKDVINLRIWIPYPVNDNWQTISDFKLSGPFNTRFITDKKYGNKIVYLSPRQKALDEGMSEIILSFKVKRKERGASFDNINTYYRPLSRFLKPDRLVPVNGELKKLALKIAEGKTDDLEKARAIYDYIIDELTYSKDDPNICGIGDSLLTLKYKKGICTDYHSLFISLARSLGIPAKFEVGFRIPEESKGKLNGYHCWAEFYLKDKGWIPVDISEADKHPERRDYFFGHIDENRIHLTSGRDISLKYAKDAQPLNFLVYPYAELNGTQFTDMDIELSFVEGGEK